MPMAQYTPPKPKETKDPIVSLDELDDRDYEHALVDPRVEAPTALLNHIQGRSWTCDYYSQVLGKDEEAKEFQPTQAPIGQQYELIKGFELKLQGSLSTSQDQNNAFNVTGSALVYPSVMPNVGDVIVAALADGRLAQFNVNSVEVKSLYRQSVYEIAFVMARLMTPSIETVLGTRVIKTYRFKYDFARYGRNPLVIESDHLAISELERLEKQTLNYWITKFYNYEWNTTLVPGQPNSTHDPYVMKAMRALFDVQDHTRFGDLRLTNLDGSDLEHCLTVYDALINKDLVMMEVVFTRCQLVPTRAFPTGTQYDGIRYAGYDLILTPQVDQLPVDLCDCCELSGGPLQRAEAFVSSDVYPNTTTGFYVFSEAFYAQQTPYTQIEALVWDYLNDRSIPYQIVKGLLTESRKWPLLEQFYHIPVLLILCRAATRGYL